MRASVGCLLTRSLKGKLVSAVLVCVVAMSGNPFPLDLMLPSNLIKLIPQVSVQNRPTIAFDPAV